MSTGRATTLSMLAVILAAPSLFMPPVLFMFLDFLMRPVLHSVLTTFVIFGKDNHYYAGPRTPVDECVCVCVCVCVWLSFFRP